MRLEAFYMYPVTNIKNGKTSSDLSADKGYIDIKEIKFSDCNLLMEWKPKENDISINEKSNFSTSRNYKKITYLNTEYASQSLIDGKSLDKMQVIEYNNKIYHKCYLYNYIVDDADDIEKLFLVPIKKENIQKYILKTNSLFCKKYIEKAFLEDLKDINNVNIFTLNTINISYQMILKQGIKDEISKNNIKKFLLLYNIYQYLTDHYSFNHPRSKKEIKLFDIYNGFSISEIPKALARHKRKDSYTLSKYNESLNILNELENEFIIIDNELWYEGKMPICIDDKVIVPENFLKNFQVNLEYAQQYTNNYEIKTTSKYNLEEKETKTRFTYYNERIIDNLYDKKNEETIELRKNIIKILYSIFDEQSINEKNIKFSDEKIFLERILSKENNEFLQIIANIILYLNNNKKEELLKNIQELKKYNPPKFISNMIKKCEDLELNKDIIFEKNIKL